MDAVYVPLQAEALAPFLEALPALGLSGFSVTRPFKTDVLRHLQAVDELAALSGSVNTVVVLATARSSGRAPTATGWWRPSRRRSDLKGRRVVIVGAGGAARAAALALRREGARVTVLARRRASRRRRSAAAVGCDHGDLARLAGREWDVLINATPVGSAADADEEPGASATCTGRGRSCSTWSTTPW